MLGRGWLSLLPVLIPSAFPVYTVIFFFTLKLLVEMMLAFKPILIDAVCLGIPAPWGF